MAWGEVDCAASGTLRRGRRWCAALRAAGISALILTCLFGLAVAPPAGAQDNANSDGTAQGQAGASTAGASLETARAEAQRLMQAGQFAAAADFAEQALRLSEAAYGVDADATATAAHNLGFLLRRAGKPEAAAAAFERAYKIYEHSRPAVHEDMLNLVGELGQIYKSNGRTEEVVRLYLDLIARAGREGFEGHIGVAHARNNLAFLYRSLGKRQEAGAEWEAAIAIYRTQAKSDLPAYATAVGALFDLYLSTGQSDKVRPLFAGVRRQLQSEGRESSPAAADLISRMAVAEHADGHYVASRELAEQALAILDPSGSSRDPGIVDSLNNLARAEKALANLSAAEAHYKRAIDILAGTDRKVARGILTDNLGVLYGAMGHAGEAEAAHKAALHMLEESLGQDHAAVGQAASNLASVLFDEERYGEAEPLYLRALEISERQSPRDPVLVATITDNLSGGYRMSGRPGEALALMKKALSLFQSTLPEDHPSLATMHNNLGRYLIDTRDFAAAEAELLKSIAITEQRFGADHPGTAAALTNLGELYLAMGKPAAAKAPLERALAALERGLGPMHACLLDTLVLLGRTQLAAGQADKATESFERAGSLVIARRQTASEGAVRDPRASSVEGQAFAGVLESIWRRGGAGQSQSAGRAFEAGQWHSLSSAGLAVSALSARAGAGEPALQVLVRERQDLAAEWTERDRRLTEVMSEAGPRDGRLEAGLRQRLADIVARLATIDGDLSRTYPRYQELVRPGAASVAEVQALIGPGEAVVQFVTTSEATHVFVVGKSGVSWQRLPVSGDELIRLVSGLRCGLDAAEWQRDGGKTCAGVLGIPAGVRPGRGDALPFDLDRAYGLYKVLLQPVASAIKGKSLLIVPSGPLTTLPFQVLLTARPAGADYQHAPWLLRDHATTILPAVASLKALRGVVGGSQASEPFIGFGNPLLTGIDGSDRRAWDRQDCAAVVAGSAPAGVVATVLVGVAQLFRTGSANVAELRRQPPLPETADELCAVARFVKSGDERVYLGAKATESTVKDLSQQGALQRARVIHFATHGLLAGETRRFAALKAEPALLMSPPDTPSEGDDGLLTASEVAGLKLDADWVVLSACNTASGDGGGAEALSGLARAFFFAGSRALMVSHWSVDSRSTVKLVTRAFAEIAGDPARGKAHALRQAALALVAEGGRAAHPAQWAPFVLVGEGGAADAVAQAQSAAASATGSLTSPSVEDKPRSVRRRAKAPAPSDWLSDLLGP